MTLKNEELNSEKIAAETTATKETKKSRRVFHPCCSACVIKCEKLQEQVNALTEKLKAAEEETKKLNSELQLANSQKLQASNRLNEMNVNLDEVFSPPKNEV